MEMLNIEMLNIEMVNIEMLKIEMLEIGVHNVKLRSEAASVPGGQISSKHHPA